MKASRREVGNDDDGTSADGALSALGLSAIEAGWRTLLEQRGEAGDRPTRTFSGRSLRGEVGRAAAALSSRRRLQLAHLPFVKTFDQFDFRFPALHRRAADSRAADAAVRRTKHPM